MSEFKLARKTAFSLENSGFPTRMRRSTSDCTGSGLVRMRESTSGRNRKWLRAHARKASTKHSQLSLNRNIKRSECVHALVITMNKNII